MTDVAPFYRFANAYFLERLVFFSADEFNEKMQKLSDEYATALNRLKVAKNGFANESKQLDEMQRQFDHLEIELDEMTRNRLDNSDDLIKIHKEIMDQNSKVERAKREMQITKKAMMKKVGDREYVCLLEVRMDHFCVVVRIARFQVIYSFRRKIYRQKSWRIVIQLF